MILLLIPRVWYGIIMPLYEGTGNYAHSRLMKDDINTGKQIQEVKISNDSLVFGEGIAIMNNKIYELTWQTHTVNIFDVSSLKKLKELYWPSEGWGMTQNGSNLIISTGSDTLYFVNPETFEVVKKITVSDNYGPVDSINELEWVNGYVYANVYLSNTILKIDATTGKVVGRMDMTGIREKSGVEGDPQMPDDGLVLNGIAYDSTKNSLYITGKQWPALFEIKLN